MHCDKKYPKKYYTEIFWKSQKLWCLHAWQFQKAVSKGRLTKTARFSLLFLFAQSYSFSFCQYCENRNEQNLISKKVLLSFLFCFFCAERKKSKTKKKSSKQKCFLETFLLFLIETKTKNFYITSYILFQKVLNFQLINFLLNLLKNLFYEK